MKQILKQFHKVAPMHWKSYIGRWGIAGSVMLSGATAAIAASPDFGPNVLIFDPSQSNIQQRVDDIFRQEERNQFGEQRYALLFEPGVYHLDVQVGFYTQVLGVGASPDDTEIVGAVRSTSGWMGGNATCNFWRSVENLAITPAGEHPEVQWSVSQGTDLRRDHFKGELHLWDWGWSSGGVPRQLQDRRPDRFRIAAAMALAQQRMGRVGWRRVEHGVRRRQSPA
jgi:hypothetical protein